MKEEAKQIDFDSLPAEPPSISKQPTPYYKQYQRFFADINPEPIEKYLRLLKINGIEFNHKKQQKETVIIKQIRASSNYEAVLMQVFFGPFILPLTLLNKNESSLVHYCQKIGKGASGNVYQCRPEDGQSYVVKCVNCPDYRSKKSPLVFVIQQYCFFKICSVLEVGPKVGGYLGFDMVCYADCIQFAMEKCRPSQRLHSSSVISLKQSLLRLHLLQIIHFDIKPANISFSPILQRHVFLDFGFSRIINQPLGLMKNLSFSGTVGYCSQEMNEAYFSEGRRMVDPYYNDVVGLQRSLEYLRKIRQEARNYLGNAESYFHNNLESGSERDASDAVSIKLQSPIKRQENIMDNIQLIREKQLLLIKFLYELFSMDFHYKPLQNYVSTLFPSHYKKIIDFLIHIYPNQTLKQFYRAHIQRNQYDSKQLYVHFHKHLQIQNGPEASIGFKYRINAIFDYQIGFLSCGNTRARATPVQIREKLLKGRKEFLSTEEYYTCTIQYIAFNRLADHQAITDKMRVCQVFIKEELGVTLETVQNVHKVISHLISFAISKTLNLFSLYLFSMAFEQSCILNLLKTDEIVSIIEQISSSTLSPRNKIFLFIQIDRCIAWINIRLIFHNTVDKYLIKNALAIQTEIILERKGSYKIIRNYFNFEIMSVKFYNAYLNQYQRAMRQMFGQPNEIEKKTLRLNIACKAIQYNRFSKSRALFTDFKLFEELFFQRNRQFFCSHHIYLVDYYFFTQNEADLERLLAPLRLGLEGEFKCLSFELKYLIMRQYKSPQHKASLTNYLIYVADEYRRRKTPMPEQAFTRFLSIKFSMMKQEKEGKTPPLLPEIRSRANEHSKAYGHVLIATIKSMCITNNFLWSDIAKYFLYDLVVSGQRQRLSNILNTITQTLAISQRTDIQVYYHLFMISYAKNLLRKVALMLKWESGDLDYIERESLKRIKLLESCCKQERYNEGQVLQEYAYLIYYFEKVPSMRRNFSKKFYETMKNYNFLYFFFINNNEFIFYIIEGIFTDSQCQESNKLKQVCKLIRILSQSVYITYSRRNFVKYWVSIRLFMEHMVVLMSSQSVATMVDNFLSFISDAPLLAVPLGLLLPFIKKNKLKTLIKIAIVMPLLSQLARRAIYKTYLVEILKVLQKRAKWHSQLYFYRKYNCVKLQRRIDRRMIKMGEKAKIKCRMYYNNFNSMQE